MTIGRTARLGLYSWSAPSDAFLTRLQANEMFAALDEKVAIDLQGSTLADRPAATSVPRGTFWTELASGATYRSTGSAWQGQGSPMASTTPATLYFADLGAVGVSPTAARADHKHPMPTLSNTLPSGLSYGSGGYAGSINEASRRDHTHPMPPAPAPTDSYWVSCVVNTPSYQASVYPVQVRKIGSQVFLQGQVTYKSGSVEGSTLATIPAGYRPGTNSFIGSTVLGGGTGTVPGAAITLMALTDGRITNPNGHYIHDSIVVNWNIPVAGTWLV